MRITSSLNTVICVLRFFNIRYTQNYVQKLLEENSDGNNLWGILSVLKIYGLKVEPHKITNQLSINEFNIIHPFITEYENNILLIKKISGNTVFACNNGKDSMFYKEDFLKNWKGIYVSICKGESVGEPNFKLHLKRDQNIWISGIAVVLSILTLCIYKISYFDVPFFIYLYFLLSVLGAFVSFQIELSNFLPTSLINKLCGLTKHSSCNQINKKSRYITALGFSYFFSLCTYILLPLQNFACTVIIVFLSVIEILWSFYVQFINHKYCINCLIVQFILMLMIIIGYFNFDNVSLQNLFAQGMLFVSIFSVTFIISIYHIWPSIADRFLYKSKSRLLDYLKKKLLENTNLDDSIIKVFLNPFCIPCREEFLVSYNLLINYGQSIVVPKIVVSDSKGEKVGMSILDVDNNISIFYRLKDWYSWGYLKPKEFELKYNTNNNEILSGLLNDNLNEAHAFNIQNTPSIIQNGIKLPYGISLVDVLTQ